MEFDLRPLLDDEVVLHFGGRPREVNAFTFANSLLAFSEALREINQQVNPGSNIEIAIDAVGTGSFRAKLKTKKAKAKGFIKDKGADLIVTLLAAVIIDKCLGPETKIIVQDGSYIVEHVT